MKAKKLADAAGCHVETIRYYERIGLLPKPIRSHSGYRSYGETDVKRLRFIVRSRKLGFDLETVRGILSLAENGDGPCRQIDGMAGKHLAHIRAKQAELQAAASELRRMLKACHHGGTAECTVLRALAG